MYVKDEPHCTYDLDEHIMTELDADFLREDLFENSLSSESGNDDLFKSFATDLEFPLSVDSVMETTWDDAIKTDVITDPLDGINSFLNDADDVADGKLQNGILCDFIKDEGIDPVLNSTAGVQDDIADGSDFPLARDSGSLAPDATVWSLLCGGDVTSQAVCKNITKQELEIPDTPPVTPLQGEDSPPHSPQEFSSTAASLPTTEVVLEPTVIPHKNEHKQTIQISNSQFPQSVRVVTITNPANQQLASRKSGGASKTLTIQPKGITVTSRQLQTAVALNPVRNVKIPIPRAGMANGETIVVNNNSRNSNSGDPSLQTVCTSAPGTRVVAVISAPVNNATVAVVSSSSLPLLSPQRAASVTATSKIGSHCLVGTTSSVSSLTPLAPAISSTSKQDQFPDLKALKRQQRMIKNRESASLSRRKKKEYLCSLEIQVRNLLVENQKLKEENSSLQHKITELEAKCASLQCGSSYLPRKKMATALFAVIFLVSLNLGPLMGVLLSQESRLSTLKTLVQQNSAVVGVFSHRSLLWQRADGLLDTNESASNSNPETPGIFSSALDANISSTCPVHINATESLRLETELRGWFESNLGPDMLHRSAKFNKQAFHPKTHEGRSKASGYLSSANYMPSQFELEDSPQYKEISKALVEQKPAAAKLSSFVYQHSLQLQASRRIKETGMISAGSRIQTFLDAIHQRDDTYYVVSFSPDHLLVPATAHNASARPRMSLLLPTPHSLNESVTTPPEHVSLLQIDCEVTKTRLVSVAQNSIPVHLRPSARMSSNVTDSSGSSKEQQHAAEKKPKRNNSRRNLHAAGLHL